ncbi:hypothetical protein HY345_01670 [Candidatus Microgenomates bacterium]|nr:hypothetical protein [Candidatus Microgenomates bacterium]
MFIHLTGVNLPHLSGGNLDFPAVLLYDQENMDREIIHDALSLVGSWQEAKIRET